MSYQTNKPGSMNTPFDGEPSNYSMTTDPQNTHVQMNMADPTQVVVQPNGPVQTFTIDSATEPWTWCNLVTSMISVWCCPIFGFIATVLSILAYVDHGGKAYERFRAKKSCAYGFSITAIVLGCISFMVTIIIVVVVVNNADNIINYANTSYGNGN